MAEVSDLEIVDASNTARFPEGMAPAAINNGARALEGMIARWYEDTDGSIASTGSANAYAVTSKRTIAALTNNTVQAFTANFANTGAATLAFNGLTAKSIKRPNGDALAADDIVSGQVVIVIYKSSPDEWRMLSPGAFQAGDAIVGGLALATQTLMEAAASLTTAVTPGRQHFHPAHPKFWAYATVSGGTPTLQTSHNVTSITDTAQGQLTVTIATDFSGANWCSLALCQNTSSGSGGGSRRIVEAANAGQAAGTILLDCFDSNSTPALADPAAWSVMGLGDHS